MDVQEIDLGENPREKKSAEWKKRVDAIHEEHNALRKAEGARTDLGRRRRRPVVHLGKTARRRTRGAKRGKR